MTTSWVGWLREACAQQCELVAILWREPRFRTPMLALWISDLGGALHMPVITYFYLKLGVTPMQIGLLGFGMRGSSMLLSPLYGRAVDRHGVARPLLLCVTSCGCGCLLRGAAWGVWPLFAAQVINGMGGGSQWSMVKGYVAVELEEAQRALLVLGLRVQMTLLSLTRLFYPLLDSALRGAGIEETLPRYRAAIATCAIFCWAGIFVLLCGKGGASCCRSDAGTTARPQPCKEVTKEVAASEDAEAAAGVPVRRCGPDFLAAAAALGMVGCGQTMCLTLWPIYIGHHFGWEARAYAYLSFAHALLSTGGLTLYPRAVQGREQERAALQVLSWLSIVSLLGFVAEPAGRVGMSGAAVHIFLGLPCLVAVATLASGVEAAASLLVPAASQGWAMGVLNAAGACGMLTGSLLGPALWTWSLQLGPALLAGGRAPFFATGLLLLLALVLLRCSVGTASKLSHQEVQDVELNDPPAKPGAKAGKPSVPAPAVLGAHSLPREGEDRELLS